MTENNEIKEQEHVQDIENPLNDAGGFMFSSGIKIFDPNSQEILVQVRGD
jgi:hypothetical protein